MITDEEIALVIEQVELQNDGDSYIDLRYELARVIYALGRQRQRESDAGLNREYANVTGVAHLHTQEN